MGTTDRVYSLTFRAPGPVVSTNKVNAAHWRRRRAWLKPWNEAGYFYAKRDQLHTKGLNRSRWRVTVSLPFATNRRRDPHNYVGTVVKALIDGMVLAGTWPDDTPEWVSVAEPVLVVSSDDIVTITIEELTP